MSRPNDDARALQKEFVSEAKTQSTLGRANSGLFPHFFSKVIIKKEKERNIGRLLIFWIMRNKLYALKQWHRSRKNVYVCIDERAFDNELQEYVAYTDGSCDNINEPHAGGAAYIIMKGGNIIRAKNKGLLNTTNNRAEMLAIVSATLHTPENSRLDIYTDSQYAMNVFSGKWGPKTNGDLIQQFNNYSRELKMVVFHWVRGHNGDKYNEMVDDMAWSAYKNIIGIHGLKQGKYARGGCK